MKILVVSALAGVGLLGALATLGINADDKVAAAKVLSRNCIEHVKEVAPNNSGFEVQESAVGSIPDDEKARNTTGPMQPLYREGTYKPVKVIVTIKYRVSGSLHEGACFYSSDFRVKKDSYSDFWLKGLYIDWKPAADPLFLHDILKVGFVDKLKRYLPLAAGKESYSL